MYESLITPPNSPATTAGPAPSGPTSIDAALAAEGVTGRAAEFVKSVYQQESGSGSNTKTSNAGAVGGMQIIPATFKSVADSGWDINNPEHNLRAGIRYAKQGFDAAGGDPALAGAYYYGGPGGMAKARQGVAVSDPRNPRAPNTLQYGQQVASRMGGEPVQAPSYDQFYAPQRGQYASLITPPPDRGAGGAIRDTGLALGQGVVGAFKSITDLAGANNPVSETLDGASKFLQGQKSAQSQATLASSQARVKEAEATGDWKEEVGAYMQMLWDQPAEMIAQGLGSFATMGAGKVLQAAKLANAAKASGMSKEAFFKTKEGAEAIKAASDLGFRANIGMGAGQGVGAVKGSQYEQTFNAAKARGMSDDEADALATEAQAYGGAGTGQQILGGVLGAGAAATGPIERLIAGKGAASGARGIASGGAKGFAVEAVPEGTQGAQERLAGNESAINAGVMDESQRYQGVAGQGLMEGAIGGVLGGGAGAIESAVAPAQVVPPELKPVADKAAEPNSPLSKAAMAGASATAAMPQPEQAAPQVDPITARVVEIENEVRQNGVLQTLRGIGQNGLTEKEFLEALAIARNPAMDQKSPLIRQRALESLEEALGWAREGRMPGLTNERGLATTEQPSQPGTNLATQQGGPLSTQGPADFFDPNTVDVDATRVDNMIGGPRAIEGPRARLGMDGNVSTQPQNFDTTEQRVDAASTIEQPASQPAPEMSAPATQDIPARPVQQTVEQATEGMLRVQIPAATAEDARTGNATAARRKRRAQVEQLVGAGFETVERRDNQFVLKNAKTKQEVILDGAVEAQLARAAIARMVADKANTAAASPLNDRLEPTPAQIAAHNYKKSDVIELNGTKIVIENPAGSTRRGVGADGKAWETKMTHHYGEFVGTEGADGDRLDVFIGPRPDSAKVYVVDQKNQDGSFDEHKIVMGATTEDQARQVYLSNYEKGWTGLGAITEMSLDDFKAWAKSERAKQPLMYGKQDRVITVNDGGNPVQILPLDAADVGENSAARTGKGKVVSKKDAELIRSIAAIFGVDAQFFHPVTPGFSADGFFNGGNTLYINERTTVTPLAIFGHEFMHLIKERMPQAYDSIAKVVSANVKDPKGYRADYFGQAYADENGDASLTSAELEELVSDLNGNLMTSSKFWREVFDQVAKDHGKEAKGIIARLSAFLGNAIDMVVSGLKGGRFNAGQFVNNTKDIRAAFKDGLAQYLAASDISKTAMQAEILRSEQQAKKVGDIKRTAPRATDGLTIEGYHFSKEARPTLTTGAFGTGLKGSDRDEIMSAKDGRLKQRLSFYVNKGTGVRPESGVGGIAHKAELTNLYDADADAKRLKQGRGKRDFESAVLDSGYSGYLTRLDGTQPGQAILLGPQTVRPEVLGPRTQIPEAKAVPAPAQREMDLGDKIMANKSLPAGQMDLGMWSRILMSVAPDVHAQLNDIGAFDGSDGKFYKDELVARARAIEAGAPIKASQQRITVDGVDRPVENSLGLAIAADREALEKFWRMYGDSPMVDKEGRPVVLFHGTPNQDDEGISIFNRGTGIFGQGIYLTAYPGRANGYTGKSGAIYPVYAFLRNAISSDDVLERFGGTIIGREKQAAATNELRGEGYGGIINMLETTDGPRAWEVVAFNPESVKSAISNNGEWSSFSQDIRKSTAKQDPAIGDKTDVSKLPVGREVPGSVAVGGLESSLEMARAKSYRRGRDLKVDIQAAVLAAAKEAKVRLTDKTKAMHKLLSGMVVNDAEYALQSNENAVGWYNQKVSRALGALSTIHPEIDEDPRSRLAFLWALATTSNGLEVSKNFELAERAYSEWKRAGVMPSDYGIGTAAQQINVALAHYNELAPKIGDERLLKFMSTTFTVGEIKRMLGVKPGGEWMGTPVRGAAILGPKIGNGFFSNLNGYFDALTMDRWLMRTWGRMTGTLIDVDPKAITKSRNKLAAAASAMTAAERKQFGELIGERIPSAPTKSQLDAISKASQKASMKTDKREVMMSTDTMNTMRKAANLHHMTLDGQKEAPSGPAERNWVRAVFQTALEQLRANGKDMTMSDLQALLWYPERRLYDAAKSDEDVANGYEDDEAPDYANAGMNLAIERGVSRTRVLAAMDAAEARGTVQGEQLTEAEKAAMLEELRQPPAQPVQLAFEVAPDPNNQELTKQWSGLPTAEKARITKLVKDAVLSEVVDAVGAKIGKTVSAIGGYMGKINPNLIAEYKQTQVPMEQARALAAAIGMALDQDSVALVDPRVNQSNGIVRITLATDAGKVSQELFAAISAAVPEVDAFTARGKNFDVLNFTGMSTEELAGKIDEAVANLLDDGGTEYVVLYGDVKSELIEKDTYASEIEKLRPGSGREILGRIEGARDRAREIVAAELGGRSTGEVPGRAGDARRADAGAEIRLSAARDGSGRAGAGQEADRSLAASERAAAQEALSPLPGAPTVKGAAGPDPRLVSVAEKYARDNGITLRRQAEYVKVDPERAKRIADAYEAMPHDPQNPRVKEAYQNLIKQTRAQYDALAAAGYKFWFMDMGRSDNQEYASSPWNAMRDVRANQQMGVFPTADGFGTKEDFTPDSNPLLEDTGLRWPVGSASERRTAPVLANDLFRAVHDAFGHGLEGSGFRAEGEENAWQAHVRLFTGSAVGAITTETRGQNSFLNYGPHGEKNRTAKVEDTIFADQKTGLLPEWVWNEGRADDAPQYNARIDSIKELISCLRK